MLPLSALAPMGTNHSEKQADMIVRCVFHCEGLLSAYETMELFQSHLTNTDLWWLYTVDHTIHILWAHNMIMQEVMQRWT